MRPHWIIERQNEYTVSETREPMIKIQQPLYAHRDPRATISGAKSS